MKRDDKILTNEEIPLLEHLIKSLEELDLDLEDSYREGDHGKFDNTKKLMLKIQEKISEIIK